MDLRDEWRERVAEALPCTPRCYPATRSGHSNGCTRSRHTTADQLLAPGGVVSEMVDEARTEARAQVVAVLRLDRCGDRYIADAAALREALGGGE